METSDVEGTDFMRKKLRHGSTEATRFGSLVDEKAPIDLVRQKRDSIAWEIENT